MEQKSLRLFTAIAETGSFARAAVQYHTVQSNVRRTSRNWKPSWIDACSYVAANCA